MPTATRYPTAVSGDGWANPLNATAEGGGAAVHDQGGTTDLRASGFGFAADVPANATITRVHLGVKASAVPTGQYIPALDGVRMLTDDGPVNAAIEGHMGGIPQGWGEIDMPLDGVTAAVVRRADFGMVATFWNSIEGNGNAVVSVDALRITVEWS